MYKESVETLIFKENKIDHKLNNQYPMSHSCINFWWLWVVLKENRLKIKIIECTNICMSYNIKNLYKIKN